MGKGFVYSYLDKSKKDEQFGKFIIKYAWYDSGSLHSNEIFSEKFGKKQDKYKSIKFKVDIKSKKVVIILDGVEMMIDGVKSPIASELLN